MMNGGAGDHRATPYGDASALAGGKAGRKGAAGTPQAQVAGAVDVHLETTARNLAQHLLTGIPELAQLDARAAGWVPEQTRLGGTVKVDAGKYGFIAQDSGEADVFCLPPVHPVGSRVHYDVVLDPKTNVQRADKVSLDDGSEGQTSIQSAVEQLLLGGLLTVFGAQAAAPQAALTAAPHGAQGQWEGQYQYQYESEATAMAAAMAGQYHSEAAAMAAAIGRSMGTMGLDRGNFSFIKQDSGEEDMFTLPPLFPQGTRVMFDVVLDPKTGRPRAENVTDEQGNRPPGPGGQAALQNGAGAFDMMAFGNGGGGGGGGASAGIGMDGKPMSQASESRVTGTVCKSRESFGFISQDSNESEMFVLPHDCEAFGRVLPPLGTRVVYQIGLDIKTGKPRAENVQPELSMGAGGTLQMATPVSKGPFSFAPGSMGKDGKPISHTSDKFVSGSVSKSGDKFGFITQDSGESDMFLLPHACEVFGRVLPPPGTRVIYNIGLDPQQGNPRAENVQPEPQMGEGGTMTSVPAFAPASTGLSSFMPGTLGKDNKPISHTTDQFVGGTVSKSGEKFGFITQDSGESDVFLLPHACEAFGGVLPLSGTRVIYNIGLDPIRGNTRAENVQPMPHMDGIAAVHL